MLVDPEPDPTGCGPLLGDGVGEGQPHARPNRDRGPHRRKGKPHGGSLAGPQAHQLDDICGDTLQRAQRDIERHVRPRIRRFPLPLHAFEPAQWIVTDKQWAVRILGSCCCLFPQPVEQDSRLGIEANDQCVRRSQPLLVPDRRIEDSPATGRDNDLRGGKRLPHC